MRKWDLHLTFRLVCVFLFQARRPGSFDVSATYAFMGNQACCDTSDASQTSEIKAECRPEPALGVSELPVVPAADVGTPAVAAGGEATPPAPTEYAITLDKSRGDTKMGIDVDDKDGETLLIEVLTDGLIKMWNDDSANKEKVSVGDRIVEVNGRRTDSQQLVEECKKNQVLKMKLRRA
eukprot:TRINITY_DN18352_c0_g1_i1.p1 TRINITY_DN18352_c0_g1~~TRINITY_DN18352_c0_g1_i1.p1  ORF type:complete len:179 (+),score=27.01 TRINITY_DN18352_c0_g1_i1:161-697(+)